MEPRIHVGENPMKIEEAEIDGHRLKFRTWNYGMKQEALRAATKFVQNASGELEPEVDPWVLNDQLLLKTLVDWDFLDEKGARLPITLDSVKAIEPPELVDRMIAFAQRLNSLSQRERFLSSRP